MFILVDNFMRLESENNLNTSCIEWKFTMKCNAKLPNKISSFLKRIYCCYMWH